MWNTKIPKSINIKIATTVPIIGSLLYWDIYLNFVEVVDDDDGDDDDGDDGDDDDGDDDDDDDGDDDDDDDGDDDDGVTDTVTDTDTVVDDDDDVVVSVLNVEISTGAADER